MNRYLILKILLIYLASVSRLFPISILYEDYDPILLSFNSFISKITKVSFHNDHSFEKFILLNWKLHNRKNHTKDAWIFALISNVILGRCFWSQTLKYISKSTLSKKFPKNRIKVRHMGFLKVWLDQICTYGGTPDRLTPLNWSKNHIHLNS